MTPGEWAADVVDGFLGYAGHTNADAVLREQVEAAVRAAVIEEREACAKVAGRYTEGPGDEGPGTAACIAAAIRERK
jgi:hypothetical protein